jgi:catechol 2,3-dioxygenase-like lactoylglutathione lyase family enzyme
MRLSHRACRVTLHSREPSATFIGNTLPSHIRSRESRTLVRSDGSQPTGGIVQIANVVAQLRTTDLAESIRFYTGKLGFTLEFQYEDFYAGIRAGSHVVHLKLVDEPDPSIAFVDRGEHFHLYLETDDVSAAADRLRRNGVRLEQDVHETAWGTREFVIKDDQGHTVYFGQPR